MRDFTQVFDAYAQFEEKLLGQKMDESADAGEFDRELDLDVELRLARFENLMDRRPLLLNSVLLRQNPHNVSEWHKRVKLYEGQPAKVCAWSVIKSVAENILAVFSALQGAVTLFALWGHDPP